MHHALPLILLSVLATLSASEPAVRFGVCDWMAKKCGDNGSFALAKRLGYDGVQVSLNLQPGDRFQLSDRTAQKACLDAAAAADVVITSLVPHCLVDIPLKDDPRAERLLEQAIAIARDMDRKVILVPFFCKGELRWKDTAAVGRVVAAFRRIAPVAEKSGVTLAIESVLSAEEHLALIRRVGSPALRVYYDVANAKNEGYDVPGEIRLLKEHIVEMHAKDTKGAFGQGMTDFAAVRQAMEAIHYRGWFVVEGTEMPMGLEETLRHDVEHLRSIFR